MHPALPLPPFPQRIQTILSQSGLLHCHLLFLPHHKLSGLRQPLPVFLPPVFLLLPPVYPHCFWLSVQTQLNFLQLSLLSALPEAFLCWLLPPALPLFFPVLPSQELLLRLLSPAFSESVQHLSDLLSSVPHSVHSVLNLMQTVPAALSVLLPQDFPVLLPRPLLPVQSQSLSEPDPHLSAHSLRHFVPVPELHLPYPKLPVSLPAQSVLHLTQPSPAPPFPMQPCILENLLRLLLLPAHKLLLPVPELPVLLQYPALPGLLLPGPLQC